MSWWDSISDGFNTATDWLGGSGGQALNTVAGIAGAGMDLYSGYQNMQIADRFGNMALGTAKRQSELSERQLDLALSPELWDYYRDAQIVGMKQQSHAGNLALNRMLTLTPLQGNIDIYTAERGLQDINQQRALDPMFYDAEKSVVRKLTEGEDVLRDRMTKQAYDDTSLSFARQGENLRNELGLAGISSTSQQYANSLTQMKQNQALAEASAMTQASRQAEDLALSRQSQALNYRKGAPLPSYQYTPQSNVVSTAGASSGSGNFGAMAGMYNQAAGQNWQGLGATLQNLTGGYINK